MSKRRRRSFNGNSNSHLDWEHKRVERSLVGVGGWLVYTQAPNTDLLEIKLMILGYQIGMVWDLIPFSSMNIFQSLKRQTFLFFNYWVSSWAYNYNCRLSCVFFHARVCWLLVRVQFSIILQLLLKLSLFLGSCIEYAQEGELDEDEYVVSLNQYKTYGLFYHLSYSMYILKHYITVSLRSQCLYKFMLVVDWLVWESG